MCAYYTGTWRYNKYIKGYVQCLWQIDDLIWGEGGGKNEDNSYFKKCVWETINQR